MIRMLQKRHHQRAYEEANEVARQIPEPVREELFKRLSNHTTTVGLDDQIILEAKYLFGKTGAQTTYLLSWLSAYKNTIESLFEQSVSR